MQKHASGCTAAGAVFIPGKYSKAYENSVHLRGNSPSALRTGEAGSEGRCLEGDAAKNVLCDWGGSSAFFKTNMLVTRDVLERVRGTIVRPLTGRLRRGVIHNRTI